jgi:ribosome-binding factor A
MTTRQKKVGELLRSEISDIIQREIRDPRLGFVTVTEVDVTPDMRIARVFVSVMGEHDVQEAAIAALNKARGFVRLEIGKRITMRITPEIEFRLDHSIEHGARIFELLQQIKQDESEEE